MSSNALALTTMSDVRLAAVAMSASGFFQDAKSEAQAVVKILAGQEMGFGPFASMIGVSIIQGKPSIGANLIAAAIKRSGRYNYRIITLDDTACEVAFFEAGEEVGRSRFTLEDAKKANLNGKSTWQAYPRNLLFARAISNGARWYCPDIFGGGPVYTPEELGAAVNENGDVIDVSATKQASAAVLEPQGATLENSSSITPDMGGNQPLEGHTTPISEGEKQGATLEPSSETITQAAIKAQLALYYRRPIITEKQARVLAPLLEGVFASGDAEAKRHLVLRALTGKSSLKEIDLKEASLLWHWLKPYTDTGGAWLVSAEAAKQLNQLVAELDALNQPSLLATQPAG